MPLEFTPYVFIRLAAVGLLITLVIVVHRQKNAPNLNTMVWLMLAVGGWLAGYILVTSDGNLSNDTFWTTASQLSGLILAPVAFTLSGVSLAWSLTHLRWHNRVSTARSAALEVLSNGVIVLDTQGRLVDLNPAAAGIINRKQGASGGHSTEQVFSHWPELVDHIKSTKSGHAEIAWVSREDGSRIFDVQVSLLRDHRKQIIGQMLVIQDITCQKQDREALHRQALIYENIYDSVILTDQEGRIIDCNPATGAMFGYTKKEVWGKSPAIWYKPGEYAGVKSKIIEGISQEGFWSGELNFIHKNGGEGVCEAVIFPLIDEHGQQIATIGVSHDITHRKRTEAELLQAKLVAEEAYRAKSALLTVMGHEFRTPLSIILGFTEILLEKAKKRNHIDFIPQLENTLTSTIHLESIIEDILNLSQIEAGKMAFDLQIFDLKGLVEEVTTSVQPLIERNDNTLQVLYYDNDLGLMRSDQTKVRQVLLNLLGNAAKFTEKGQITMEAFCETVDSNRWINFRVIDTGVGMTSEQLDSLFQPFVRAKNALVHTYKGTGLGLTISHQLCKMIGGDIQVQSELGHGTTFSVRFPLEITEGQVNKLAPFAI